MERIKDYHMAFGEKFRSITAAVGVLVAAGALEGCASSSDAMDLPLEKAGDIAMRGPFRIAYGGVLNQNCQLTITESGKPGSLQRAVPVGTSAVVANTRKAEFTEEKTYPLSNGPTRLSSTTLAPANLMVYCAQDNVTVTLKPTATGPAAHMHNHRGTNTPGATNNKQPAAAEQPTGGITTSGRVKFPGGEVKW